MIERVRINDQTGKQLGQRRQRGVIGNVGRGEQQSGVFLMQIGKLGFQALVVHRGAGNIARAARTGAGGVDRGVHGGQNHRVLAHAQIIVAAPDSDLLLAAIGLAPDGMRIGLILAFDINERPVPAFIMQALQRVVELAGIRHPGLRKMHQVIRALIALTYIE